jgi:formylglycine-generating enzyme required for sulfatase activity
MPTPLEAALKDAVRAGLPVSEGWRERLGFGPALPRGDVGALWVLALPDATDDPSAPPWSPRHLHMLPVPGGTFWMGATKNPAGPNFDLAADDDEGPPRKVTVSDFWLGVHPVTNAQYRTFVAATGHRESGSERQEGFYDDGQPVTGVDWEDARAFCKWVSGQLPKGLVCDLPTEAGWERAARGDDGLRYPWGAVPPSIDRAVFSSTSPKAVAGRAAGAGPFGHHDLAGQVWEWCRDAYGPYKALSPDNMDPWNDAEGADPRVARGGSWFSSAWWLRTAFRDYWRPGDRNDLLGFRVCVRRERG